jgi:hypothetical protein
MWKKNQLLHSEEKQQVPQNSKKVRTLRPTSFLLQPQPVAAHHAASKGDIAIKTPQPRFVELVWICLFKPNKT